VARHVVELQREWDKAERNASHIKTLLRETRSDRIALLEGDPVVGCWMQGILEKYPCFAECTFVRIVLFICTTIKRYILAAVVYSLIVLMCC